MVPIASGRGHEAAIRIRQRGAALWGGRLGAGEVVSLPAARFSHLFVARGEADLESVGRLGAGDAVRMTESGPLALTASPGGAEVLLWEMDGEPPF